MTPEQVKLIEDASNFIWPIGKTFKGRKIGDISSSYLKWAAENISNDNLATKADIIWQFREVNGEHIED